MVDRVAQDRNETEDYSMKNEMENGQEPQDNLSLIHISEPTRH